MINAKFNFNIGSKSLDSIIKYYNLSDSEVVIPQQVHSNSIKYVNKAGLYQNTDGIVTDIPGLLLVIQVADCVPVYFYDLKNKIIGLVHSGWRGTINGIIINTIKLMLKKGSLIQDINIYMGPSIKMCCYEVKQDVASHFSDNAKICIRDDIWYVDIKKEITNQLTQTGVTLSNINCSNLCTYESYHCHSYRKNGAKSGRMYAFMEIKD